MTSSYETTWWVNRAYPWSNFGKEFVLSSWRPKKVITEIPSSCVISVYETWSIKVKELPHSAMAIKDRQNRFSCRLVSVHFSSNWWSCIILIIKKSP